MPATQAGAAVMNNALAGAISHVAALSGTTERSIARMPYVFPATTGDTLNATDDVSVDLADLDTANTLGFYDAVAGGNLLYVIPLGSTESNPTPGGPWKMRIDAATINNSNAVA